MASGTPGWSGQLSGFGERLAGRTVWNVSSTAVGGGVAEMLQVLVGYVQDLRYPDPLAGDHR